MAKQDLNARISEAVDKAAEEIVRMLVDSQKSQYANNTPRRFHELALEIVGINEGRLRWLSENDDNNPQYTLYYCTLSTLAMKACARAGDKLVY